MGKTVQKKTRKLSEKIFLVTPAHDALMRLFPEYHFMTIDQVRRAKNFSSFTHVSMKLKELSDHDYLRRLALPTLSAGQPIAIYTLSMKGRNYLEEQGYELGSYYRPVEHKHLTSPFLVHTLEINNFLIDARTLCSLVPAFSLESVRHDLMLKQTPFKVSMTVMEGEKEKQKTVSLVPDAWLDFRMDRGKGKRPYRYCIWLELDRGTHDIKPFKQKLRALLSFMQSPGMKTGLDAKEKETTIAFVTTVGDKRVEEMRGWVRQVLAKTHEGMNDKFVFTAMPPLGEKPMDAKRLFLEPVWYRPFGDNPSKLLGD
ncbi:MAG: replication-relaxation family protein [Flavisolibacter sp.]